MAKSKQDEKPAGETEAQAEGMHAFRVEIAELTLDPENVIKHSQPDIDATARSLSEFGQQSPIVITKDRFVLKGNGTVMAAKQLKWTSIWAIETELNGNRARAYAIADNKTGRLAGWDDHKLEEQVRAIAAENETMLRATGFGEEELNRMLEKFDETTVGPPGEPVEIRGYGRIWLLIGAPPSKGLEVAELSQMALEKLGEDAFVETSIGS